MFTVSINKGRAIIEVHISGITEDRPATDDFLKGYAAASAKEDPSSLFGYNIKRYDGGAVVTLWKD